ncbi:hypothetical protein [Actinopolymorpha pittospori]|uniref:Uncharacterized protein n=1 Tax=Actinopolymorpha pittospori TaxID=648752 RepID=A0A927MQI5_9ACTN|nr:hypothetical protein [Actinopolymorpha pittospori]MBE1603383.1 hypothetical protein [Actinopolymorpha pittospori]
MWSDLDQSLELLGALIGGIVLLIIVLPRLEDDLTDRSAPARHSSDAQTRRLPAWRPPYRDARSRKGGDRD